MNNPIDFIKLMSQKMTPEQLAMKLLEGNSNPMLKNLIQLAKNGDKQSVEVFAKNLFKEQGKNFDKEYEDFMKSFQ